MNKNLIIETTKRGYKVDDLGNVISKFGVKRKLNINNRGYYYFSVRFCDKVRMILVHRLKAYNLFGDALFEKDIEVRHLDGNKLNNSTGNIKIGTHSDNMMDIPKEKRILNASNPKHDHISILKDKENGMSYRKLMDKYNISSKGTISFIVNKSLSQNSI